jgi:hypothetical protein
MTDSLFEGKKLIPIGELRLLNKRFGWEKSFNEMYEQNYLDYYLFDKECEVLARVFWDEANDKPGGTAECIESIEQYWLKLILLFYRTTTRGNLIKMSEYKRGIPESKVQEFIEDFNSRRDLVLDSLLNMSAIHFYWLNHYLRPAGRSKSEMEKVIWNTYVDFLNAAKEITKLSSIPSESYFEAYEIEARLRDFLSHSLSDVRPGGDNE